MRLESPGLTAVGTILQPANFVDIKVWLRRFLALLITLLLPSSGSWSTLFSTTTMSFVASSPTTKHSAVYTRAHREAQPDRLDSEHLPVLAWTVQYTSGIHANTPRINLPRTAYNATGTKRTWVHRLLCASRPEKLPLHAVVGQTLWWGL